MGQSVAQRTDQVVPKEYGSFLKEIKDKILSSQVKAALAVNRELITRYWEIGSKIHLKQKSEGWGAKTIENLSKDLKNSFPNMQGFSSRNLKYMVHFAKEYPDFAIGQQAAAQIPWGHNILLLQKLTSLEERLWYINKTLNMAGVVMFGLLLCKGKNKVVAEYAIRDINKPIGISQYEAKIIESLPDELKGSLPSIEQIEQEFEDREL
jgi:predicted nuclease of restriction endonuclease-like (RecB) superfamily